jgi:hypothetical protein
VLGVSEEYVFSQVYLSSCSQIMIRSFPVPQIPDEFALAVPDNILDDAVSGLERVGSYWTFNGSIKRLAHPLSKAMYERCGSSMEPAWCGSGPENRCIHSMDSASFLKIFKSFDDFIELLTVIVTCVSNNSVSSIRSDSFVRTRNDARGDSWSYVDPLRVLPSLQSLWHFLLDNYFGPNKFSVVVAFVVIFTTIHPFSDSNGKTARILFNLLIFGDVCRAQRCYMPVKGFSILSQYGYELALANARLLGRWSIICRWHANMIVAIDEIMKNHRNGVAEYSKL